MPVLTKKGFLLVDSLICVFVASLVCASCYAIFHNITNYEEGYISYQERSNNNLENIFFSLWECEECIIDESD